MTISQKERSETILAALKIVDPDCIADGHEQEIVRNHIDQLITKYGCEEALRQIEGSKHHLRAQLEQMVM